VAIALDGGVPDYGADGVAGAPRLGIFKRQRDNAAPPAPEPAAPATGDPAARPRGGAHRAPSRRSGRGGPAERASARPAPDGLAPRPVTPVAAPLIAAPVFTADPGPPDAGPAPRAALAESAADPADFGAGVVQETFAFLTANAPLAMEHFYSHLFISSPETRAMFPMEMSQMRERLFGALSRLVQILDRPAESAAYLAQLGRDHRKYGVKDQHFDAFFAALLDTVAHFAGSRWSPETETAWRGALEYAARTMRSAAAADARDYPAWWVGEIVEHDRRGESVAVLTIRPDRPLPYRAGQYVPVQVPRWPRVWRPYSIANAPRADGLIHLHVRAVPGGMVSADLVRHAGAGDTLLLGPAAGEMTAPPPGGDGDLVCIAGGTGLAPVKAIVETAVGSRRGDRPRRITLFVGAPRLAEVYDLPDLAAMQSAYPGLRVILVLSDESVLSEGPLLSPQQAAAGLTAVPGLLAAAAADHGAHSATRTYVCGPPALVRQVTRALAGQVPAGLLLHDPLPAGPPSAAWGSEPASPGEPADFRQSPLFAKFAGPGFAPEQAARR
jgi:NAD(P)H-flavin reductase/hemoglobin-like flavoprotein